MTKEVADKIGNQIDNTVELALKEPRSEERIWIGKSSLIGLNHTITYEQIKGVSGQIFTHDPGISEEEADSLRKRVSEALDRL